MNDNDPRGVAPRVALVVPGQRVMTSAGVAAVVAFVAPNGVPFAWVGRSPIPRPVIVRGDMWGGEHDQGNGLTVAA